jgi:hypothetical protein
MAVVVASVLHQRPVRYTAATLVLRVAVPLFPSHVQCCRYSSLACSAVVQMKQSAPPPPKAVLSRSSEKLDVTVFF